MSGPAAWPAPVDPRDPFLGTLDDVAGPLASALRSGAPDATIESLAAAAGLDAPLGTDPPGPVDRALDPRGLVGGPHPPGLVPTDEDLVRLGTDHEPALAPRAIELVLGWGADPPPRTAIAAVAWGALLVGDAGVVPAERWSRRDAPPSLRAGARALLRTPPAVWRVERRPDGSVALHEVGGWLVVRTAEVAPPAGVGDACIARVVPTRGGWHVATAIPVAWVPDPATLHRWLRRVTLAERARGTTVTTTAQALRLGGHHLARWLLAPPPGGGPTHPGAPVTGTDDDPYADALLYDLEYADHTEDIEYYVARARACGGTVLELGCGTGRLTLPIARDGQAVVGVDRAQPMLDALHRKLADEPEAVQQRVTTVCADYLAPAVPGVSGTFAGVLWPFNALHHCADEEAVLRALDRIGGWLEPGGALMFDCYLPDRELYDRDPEERYEPRTFRQPSTGARIESWEQGWWDEAGRIHHVLYTYRWPDGTERRTHLRLRMFELAELRAIVARAGWRITHEWEDFARAPLSRRPLKWVGVLRR